MLVSSTPRSPPSSKIFKKCASPKIKYSFLKQLLSIIYSNTVNNHWPTLYSNAINHKLHPIIMSIN